MIKKGKSFLSVLTNQLYTLFIKHKYQNHKHLILLIVLLLGVYWQWWMPGLRVATDFPVVSLTDLKDQLDFPQSWFSRGSIGLGGYSVFTLWSWPMDFLAGILSNFGFTFEVLERIMFVVPILFFGIYGIWKLMQDFELSKTAKLVGSIFFLCNSYILLLIDGGQLGIGLAYAWFPIAYFLFIKSVNNDIKYKIVSGIALWILGVFDIRFVYVLGILLAFRFIFFGWTWGWIKSGLISTFIFIGLGAYWMLPLIKFPISNNLFSDLTQTSNLNFTQLKNSVSLLQPHWYENIFGNIPPFKKEFLLIPILVSLSLLFNRKNKEVWFWVFIALISVFLTKGANPPFPDVYTWLFSNIPGFSLFRDSTKFFFLTAVSYTVLIGFTVDGVIRKIPKIKLIFPLLVVLYLLLLISPVYLGKMTGTFSSPRSEKEYVEFGDTLESDTGFGKVFWIPSRPSLGYASRLHPSLEANRLSSMRPFAISTVGAYETQNFIREGEYVGELFSVLGIKYLGYPYFDTKRDKLDQEKVEYYNSFLNQISQLPWIGEKVSDGPISVFTTKESQDKFFVSVNTYFVVGSDAIYNDIKDIGDSFSDNALIFSEEKPEVLENVFSIDGPKIILYGKDNLDLVLSQVKKEEFIFPAENLSSSPSDNPKTQGWWRRGTGDLIWWRDFIQQKYRIDNVDFDYSGGWAIAEGEQKLLISNDQFSNSKTLFARVMKSSKGGIVNFYQQDHLIGSINTSLEKPEQVKIKLTGNAQVPDQIFSYDKSEFVWQKVGDLISDKEVEVKTEGQINVLNSLIVLDSKQLNELETKTNLLYSQNRVVDWNRINVQEKKSLLKEQSKTSVSYKQLSPTHYKVNISGLSKPTTLVFSDMYDSLWEVNRQSSYPLFSLINGFWIKENGEYDVYFAPQKYVYLGLIISGMTLTSCIMFLIWKR